MSVSVRLRHRQGAFLLDVAFDAPEGITALFGPSGAGKSTVIAAVAGLMRPQEGRIVVAGRVLFDSAAGVDVAAHRRRIGTVFQDGRLFPHLTVAGNLAFARRFAAGGGADPAPVVDLLGLRPLLRRRPASLSGGEKQRTAVARALLSNPSLLLLDEPLAALDEARKADILPYLQRVRAHAGVPMLYVSHAVSEVVRLADTVVLMREGRAVATGPVGEVLSDLQAAAAMGPREAGAVLDGVVVAHDPADGLSEVALAAGRLTLPAIAAPEGTRVRVRLRASEVIVALVAPDAMSTRNVLPAVVAHVQEGVGPGALVALRCGPDRLLARLTRRAARALDLSPGRPCFAILKAVAVAPEDIAVRPAAAPGCGARDDGPLAHRSPTPPG